MKSQEIEDLKAQNNILKNVARANYEDKLAEVKRGERCTKALRFIRDRNPRGLTIEQQALLAEEFFTAAQEALRV